ncbi:recQ-mediated genome instability protein 1 [Phalaenopsis equestris]|uniref:recQ-mediated genome instability protein 1 n=1 Tax=Phalaenopsis equestris TaxID=78828 RepID=UPI0009E3C718|nr:recQ-mediated genome instability protein 1 [Phalaenopsis equestris]
MRRRNLRLPSSSDEDDDAPRPQTVDTLITNPRHSSPPPQNAPLEISEDEFMDVEDALSEHYSPPVSVQDVIASSDRIEATDSDPSTGLVDEFLRRVGLGLRREWLTSCLSGFVHAVPGFEGFDVDRKARMCFEQFLSADMNCCGAGILPENVHFMNKMELEGPFVLQVDEVTNVSCPLRERYHDSPAGLKRCLKLSLSDGMEHVFGMEYRPIPDLHVLSPAGMKIIIQNVQIRRGLFVLVPEVVDVLGGLVEDLDAARQRLINEVNKPPRGKRKQALLPLCQRATLAAWPSNTVNSNDANTSEAYINNNVSQANISIPHSSNDPNSSEGHINNNVSPANISIPLNLSNPRLIQDARTTSVTVNERPYVDKNVDPNTRRDSTENPISQEFGRNFNEGFVHAKESIAGRPTYGSSLNVEPCIVADVAESVQDGYAMDEDVTINEFNNFTILTRAKEIPFTYLACLLAKWIIEKDMTSSIQGRIKCILTGVKRFQFKHRSTYELLVYIDDGSYISEVFIDHNVVQIGIGYSPEDVSVALSSSDKKIKADMTETMKKYQLFLSMYEGIITLEISKNAPLPVVLEMSQGCSESDAWLLLKRLKSFTFRNPQCRSTEPIVLSP